MARPLSPPYRNGDLVRSTIPRRSAFCAAASVLLALFLGISCTAGAAARQERNREDGLASSSSASPLVIVALVDGLDPEIWLQARPPFVRELGRRGGIGFMNLRTAGEHDPASAHLTLGAGARSRAGQSAGLAFDRDDRHLGLPAAEVYARRFSPQGKIPSGEGTPPASLPAGSSAAVLHLGWAEQQHLNAAGLYGSRPGKLGSALEQRGRRIALLGNQDGGNHPRRYGALVAMNERGEIPLGRVGGDLLTLDPGFPFGPRTDYGALTEAALALAPEADVILLELGDLARLGDFEHQLPAPIFRAYQEEVLRRIDGFLAFLQARLSRVETREQEWWWITPTATPSLRQKGVYITPVAWGRFGSGQPSLEGASSGDASAQHGTSVAAGGKYEGSAEQLLYSPRTRRPGLVTAADVTAALAAPSGAIAVLQRVEAARLHRLIPGLGTEREDLDAWAALAAFYRRAVNVNEQRPAVLRSYILVVIAVLVVWTGWLLTGRLRTPGNVALWRWVLLFIAAMPAALLLLPLVHSPSLAVTMFQAVIVALALSGAATIRAKGPGSPLPFVRLAAFTAALIAWDVLRGSPWMKHSLLGYDPILGSRFYGIGNEFMGVFIGGLLVGSAGSLDYIIRAKAGGGPRPWMLTAMALLYLAAVILLMWPRGGANVGGTITAAVACGATFWMVSRRMRRKEAVAPGTALAGAGLLIAGGLAVLVAVAVRDAQGGAAAAHLGQFAATVGEGNWQEVTDVLVRKLQTNVRLVRHTIWSRVLLLSLAISAWLLIWSPRPLKRIYARHRFLAAGVQGTVIASLVALAVNDSGVVAAATAMIPATTALLYLMSVRSARPRQGDSRFCRVPPRPGL